MANPQAENGHIDIANEIAEAFFRLQLSGNQWRVLWVIIRQTYGWHKKSDKISITKFEQKTGLKRRHIHRALSDLIERSIVTKIGNGRLEELSLQKDWEKWGSLPKLVTNKDRYQKSPSSLPKMVTTSLPKLVHTKEKKETIQKKERNFDLGILKIGAILNSL